MPDRCFRSVVIVPHVILPYIRHPPFHLIEALNNINRTNRKFYDFYQEIRKYLADLNHTKPVIMCGDLNVAHEEIDLKNPKNNRGNAGFTDEERNKMTQLLDAGFTDSFRFLYPEKKDEYSWWSYMGRAREKNIGWRIDYFIVSNTLNNKIKEANIYSDVFGSDHCPVGLKIDL